MSKTYSVYAIICKVNKKIYIGRTTNIKQRINNHFDNLKGNNHKILDLQEDFNKYGIDNFEVYLLEEDIDYTDRKKEYDYMREYNTFDKKYGYNQGDLKSSQKREIEIIKKKPINFYKSNSNKNSNSIKEEKEGK